MAVFVQACNEADLDVATQTCTAPYFIPQSGVLPPLSIEEAQAIGAAIAVVLAIAWVFRRIAKFINQSG